MKSTILIFALSVIAYGSSSMAGCIIDGDSWGPSSNMVRVYAACDGSHVGETIVVDFGDGKTVSTQGYVGTVCGNSEPRHCGRYVEYTDRHQYAQPGDYKVSVTFEDGTVKTKILSAK